MARPAAVRALRDRPGGRRPEAVAASGKGRAEELSFDAATGAGIRGIERPCAYAGQPRGIDSVLQQSVRTGSRNHAGGGSEEEADRALRRAEQTLRDRRA